MAGTGQPNYGGSRTTSNASTAQGSSMGNALISSSAGAKGCINTDKIIDTGSLQLTGIQSVTGVSATILNSTTIVSITTSSGAITLTADTGGEVLGRILIIKNTSNNTATLGGATAATTKTTLCYYTGSAWANLITGGY